MRVLIIRPGDTVNLGRQGENDVQQVQFDVTGWAETYGTGSYQLLLLRPGEAVPYTADVTADGELVLWSVTETDTALQGMGEAQLILTVGAAVAKTQIYRTVITPSIGADPQPPATTQAWFDQLEGFRDEAQTARNQAVTASVSAAASEEAATQAAEDVRLFRGAPLVAATAAAMTDHDHIYVYTGSEAGYSAGNWYYWDGSAWTSGGVYNATALQTDKTLSVSDMAADAFVTGGRIGVARDFVDDELKAVAYDYATPYEQIEAGSGNWNTRIGIKRFENRVVLNKHTNMGYPTNTVRIKLSGDMSISSLAVNNTGIRAWSTGVTLKTGHQYAAVVRLIGGSSSYQPSGATPVQMPPKAVAYAAGSSAEIFSGETRIGNSVATMFVPEASKTYNIALSFVAGDWEFDNAVLLVTLQDLTALRQPVKTKGNLDGVMRIAETYFHAAYDSDSRLCYSEASTGLYANTLTYNGVNAIVCSMFVQACIAAISWQHSRYVLGADKVNVSEWWGWHSDGTGGPYGQSGANDYMLAKNLAKYFETKGILHPFDTAHNDLKPGDICFFWNPTEGIHHNGICLRAGTDTFTLMQSRKSHNRLIDGLNAGVDVNFYTYGDSYVADPDAGTWKPYSYVHLDDIPVVASGSEFTVLYAENLAKAASYGAGNDHATVKTYKPGTDLPAGFYTVNVETNLASNAYVKLSYSDNIRFRQRDNGGVTSIVFYAEQPFNQIDIFADGEVGTGYNIGRLCVVQGYCDPDFFE